MIYDTDPYLSPYRGQIDRRYRELVIRKQELAGYGRRIADAVNNHLYYIRQADCRCGEQPSVLRSTRRQEGGGLQGMGSERHGDVRNRGFQRLAEKCEIPYEPCRRR